MSSHDKVLDIFKQSRGFVTSAQVTNAGQQRRVLSELVALNSIYRVERGIYALPETCEDDMYFLQYRFTKGVFSNGTALYLHGFSDRTPINYTLTFPHGYNAKGLKKHSIKAKYVTPEIYSIGITGVMSPGSNPLRVYDIERTLCDIVKGKNVYDVQVVNHAMKTYAESKNKNMSKLITYAERLRVKPKILRYMEVLL